MGESRRKLEKRKKTAKDLFELQALEAELSELKKDIIAEVSGLVIHQILDEKLEQFLVPLIDRIVKDRLEQFLEVLADAAGQEKQRRIIVP